MSDYKDMNPRGWEGDGNTILSDSNEWSNEENEELKWKERKVHKTYSIGDAMINMGIVKKSEITFVFWVFRCEWRGNSDSWEWIRNYKMKRNKL